MATEERDGYVVRREPTQRTTWIGVIVEGMSPGEEVEVPAGHAHQRWQGMFAARSSH